MKNPFKRTPTEKELQEQKLQKEFADKMRNICNFYWEDEGHDVGNPSRNVCALASAGFWRVDCAGEEKCILMQILKR